MWLTILERKLLRQLWQLKGQILTIALVVASGVTSFLALRGTYASLEISRSRYYDTSRFADVFVTMKRAPDAIAKRAERISGVASLETRIVEEVTLPIEGLERPAYGRILSLPDGRAPATNVPFLKTGRWPRRNERDAVLVLDSFATAHGLRPNDAIDAVVNGRSRRLRIVGVALSPEFVFAIRPGAMAHDPKRYAALWMERGAVASAFGLEGAFNELSSRLEPGASEEGVRAALDRLFEPFGSSGAFGRKDQISHRILMQELAQLETLSTMVPLIFLAVAVFLVNLVLGRLVRLERSEIATLKAIGYADRAIARHYLGLVAVVVTPGALSGIAGGHLLGTRVLHLYENAFRFPELAFELSVSQIAIAVAAISGAALVGALGAVWSAVRLPPAEAMRPAAPAVYRKSWADRLSLSVLLSPSGRMVLRELERRPLRSLASSAGIAGAVALLVLGQFGWDSLVAYFDRTFLRAERHDVQVVFSEPLAPRVVNELARWPGVARAEGVRAVPVRVQHGHRSRESALLALAEDATLRRLVSKSGAVVPLAKEGVIMSRALAEVLGLALGERPLVSIREGERRVTRLQVVGLVDDSVGLYVYATRELVAHMEGDGGAVSSVLLSVDRDAKTAVEQRLRRSPNVIDISDVSEDMTRLLDMNAQIMNVWTAISVLLAASVVFGVVYNNARIAASARSRELSSLRVLGFTRREVSGILLYSLAIEVALALPLGLWLGLLWSERFMQSVDVESFRWAVHVAPQTYAMIVGVVLLAASASALWVRRSIDRLDLILVLKSRE
jgi:putative ABC transport system permease protein